MLNVNLDYKLQTVRYFCVVIKIITLIGRRLYFVNLCTVYVRSTSIIGNFKLYTHQSSYYSLIESDSYARNINITSFVIPRLFFFSFSDKALPKCSTEVLQFMWCISRNIRRRIAKILPCI